MTPISFKHLTPSNISTIFSRAMIKALDKNDIHEILLKLNNSQRDANDLVSRIADHDLMSFNKIAGQFSEGRNPLTERYSVEACNIRGAISVRFI